MKMKIINNKIHLEMKEKERHLSTPMVRDPTFLWLKSDHGWNAAEDAIKVGHAGGS